MARRVREDLEPADERPLAAPEVAPPPHVEAVLRMQATAGNHATSRLIAREPDAAPAEQTNTSSYALTVADFGIYELTSFHTESQTKVTVTFDPGKDASRFMQATAEGRPIKTVTISARGRTITLHDVVISSCTHSADPIGGEPLVSLSFDAKSLEIK